MNSIIAKQLNQDGPLDKGNNLWRLQKVESQCGQL